MYSGSTSCKVVSKLKENIFDLVRTIFSKIDEDLKSSTFDVNYSGTTANLVFIIGSKLICVNCGDSRSILSQKYLNSKITNIHTNTKFIHNLNDQNHEIIILSKDHKPDLFDEKERIISNNGRVERYSQDGAYRVWLKDEDVPGLAMSRSFGDMIAKSVGVISDPGL